ncbi:hypothetical protein [Ruminococcus sp.]|uniref:hypothetical protein n=1 Tax=Ruminococcus sp. TaxID=41978 RepID=UPI001B46D739|nr:hypothetical protein [Ruminococcus sp.]MBP5433133.1 hypothetical protein [Ruminococcus sp.]
MIKMQTLNGTTRTTVEGTAPEICADAALCALNACRMYAEYTCKTYSSKAAAGLELMQIVLQQLSKEDGETE